MYITVDANNIVKSCRFEELAELSHLIRERVKLIEEIGQKCPILANESSFDYVTRMRATFNMTLLEAKQVWDYMKVRKYSGKQGEFFEHRV